MKKYFISYWWIAENGTEAFGDSIRTSLNKNVTIKELRTWKKEIINNMKPVPLKRINILNFKEIK